MPTQRTAVEHTPVAGPYGYCYHCAWEGERVAMEEVIGKACRWTLYVVCPRCKRTEHAR